MNKLTTSQQQFQNQIAEQAENKHLLERINALECELAQTGKPQNHSMFDGRYIEIMDSIDQIVQQANNPELIVKDIVRAVRDFFGCDRVWLLFSCDPHAAVLQVPFENCLDGYPLLNDLGKSISVTPEMAECFKSVLQSKDPLVFSDGHGLSLPESVVDFSVQSSICGALYPRSGKPWMWGVSQCSNDRFWDQEEIRLFHEIGRRLSDVLNCFLNYQKLKDRDQKIRAILNNAQQFIGLLDTDGVLIEVNQAALDFLDLNAEEVLGKYFWQSKWWTHSPSQQKRLQEAINSAAQGRVDSFEAHHVALDGSARLVICTIRPVINAEGKVVYLVPEGRDVTEHKRSEQALQKSEQEVRTLLANSPDRISRIDRDGKIVFVNYTSETTVPQEIIGSSFYEWIPLECHEAYSNCIDKVFKAGEHCTFESLGRLSDGEEQWYENRLSPVFANGEVESVLVTARDITDRMEMTKENKYLESQLIQAQKMEAIGRLAGGVAHDFNNLLSPILGYGELLINQFAKNDKNVPELAEGSYAQLAVTDNGCGMDSQTINRVFDPFFTTKTEGKGTGLGLATVYGIVKQHGGHAKVESELGQGTTFSVYIPSVQEQAEHKPNQIQSDLATGAETVLVVEDEEIVLEIAATILEMSGYKVFTALNTEQCLDLAREHGTAIDLLVTDVVMPGMNGKELSEKVGEHCPGIKVLFMSGYSNEVVDHKGIVYKDVNFIQKPLSVEGLTAKVREVLDAR